MNSADNELHKEVAATLKNSFPQDSMQGGMLTLAVMDQIIKTCHYQHTTLLSSRIAQF
jgi:hypothetical protein